MNGWEPDALTAHVRIYEGADLNCAWIKYCDTTNGKPVANRENKPYPKHEESPLYSPPSFFFFFFFFFKKKKICVSIRQW